MKQVSSVLSSFLKEFDLLKQDGDICFDAIIYFSTNIKSFQLPTEVRIVRLGNSDFDTVYLLHPDVSRLGLPDMYEAANNEFIYLPGQALVIKGHSVFHGIYILSIHPQNTDCTEHTIAEIHAKTYN